MVDPNDDKTRDLLEWQLYCPVCGRVLIADNIKEVYCGEHDSYVFVHDDIEHGDDDIDALGRGIQ